MAEFWLGSIIYIAAIAGVDQELYEASYIDGAGRLRQVFSVTIPGILPTIIIMLILQCGSIMSIGYEKPYFFIILLQWMLLTSYLHSSTERSFWKQITATVQQWDTF